MIFEREKPRSALETAFAKVVAPFTGDSEQFISKVLEPAADAYAALTDFAAIRDRFGRDAARAVRSLNRIDNKDWVPAALHRLWRRSDSDRAAVGQFLIDLERLAYFLFVVRADVNERISRFAAVMDQVEPRAGRVPPANGLDLSAGEKALFKEALDGPLYRKSRVCRPVLQRLDEALSAGGAEYDEPMISIEHVLPQTVDAGSEWATLFPDEDQRAAWTHRLANLVLLTRRINTKASNWPFKRKKDEYFASSDGAVPFHITQQVRAEATWSIGLLQARQIALINRLATLWRL